MDLFGRKRGDALLDKRFWQSGDIVEVHDATSRHTIALIQKHLDWYGAYRARYRRNGNNGPHPVGCIAA